MNKEIFVVETLQALASKKKLLKQALSKLVPLCRKAPGCLQYDLFEPAQNKDEFLILMRFRSAQDLENHETSHYIKTFEKEYDQVLYNEVKCSVYYQIE
jgi:quinol monooxygenase YgiN